MVNVLVIGATGYVGQALCHSLVRSGDHQVYGLARSAAKAKILTSEEVIPIIGSISDNTELLNAIEAFHISVVVDVAGADKGSYDLLNALMKLGAARLAAASDANVKVPKLGFIYCSGTWVHGSSNIPVNDLTPVDAANAPNPPTRLTAWRPALEREILNASDVLDTMVIRPALIYGRSSAIWSIYFEPLYAAAQTKQKVTAVAADSRSRPGIIHVDDVATGFHAAIEALPMISGTGVYPVFDLVTSQESMRDILETAAKEFGFDGEVELAGTGDNLFAEAMNTSFNGNSGRAERILGWKPKRFGMVQGMGLYARAWASLRG